MPALAESWHRVEAPDDLTVRVVTKKPDPTIELMLTFPASSIVPKDYFENHPALLRLRDRSLALGDCDSRPIGR
ncbi:hypothetical protein QN219_31065 [Sinorhizobium sp. 7-81]|uniref:hypothetical protein n=1 Tax=Sinorhizobium sp. 8-89 TaxID=3049089 RepID=UPI0024C3BE6A|nr:hypothetical protein [Sinorhizobium sp. 8-89]MDK1494392.1 hypothetical protein [Sinorhizobium sp. 8-89]